MFGTRYVGAIHGLLITAWSMAGIFGPVLVNYIREYNIDPRRAEGAGLQRDHVHHGRPVRDRLYRNLLIKAVDKRFHMAPRSASDALDHGGEPVPAMTGKSARH